MISIGEASHITAAAPGGPRYDPTLTNEERKSPENGIWLCKDHAKAVDSKDPYFTVKLLKEWKQQANEATWRSVVENVPFPPAPSTPTDDELRARLMRAAAADLAVFRRAGKWPASSISLTLKIDQISEPVSTNALARAVTTFEDLILVAAPGMGKTTTIFQVADGIVEAQVGAPIIIPLGEWATMRDGLLGSVLRRASYAGISQTDLQRVAAAPGVVLLLDGWNELDSSARERARVEITRLKGELPEIGLVISTRQQALDIPFVGTRVDLLPLRDLDQMAIAREIRGDVGERLIDHAWRTPGVRELVSIPLYLTSLLASPEDHSFPTTKEEVLRHFVSALEQDAGKCAVLLEATGGFQTSYLEALAVRMTVDANTSVTDADARRIVNGASRNLVATDQLVSLTTQPDKILDALVNEHVLVRASDNEGLSFQHQQFQEWFASHEVERLMLIAVTDPAVMERLRAEVLNCRSWTESILFAIERTSRGNQTQKGASAAAILAGFDVDPLLAAEMIFRSDDDVWKVVAREIRSRIQRWHTPGKLDRAVRFMVSTGRSEFIDLLWPLLTHENDQIHLGALRAADRFRPAVFGNDAAERLAGLPPKVRRHVLSEIASNSGMEGLDLATAVAKADVDLDVKVAVAHSLSFRRAGRHLVDLLRDADNTVYDRLAQQSSFENVDDAEIRRRLNTALERQKAAELSARERLLILLRSEPSGNTSCEVITLLSDLDINKREDHDRHLIWELNERYPEAVAEAVLRRLRARRELFYGADDILAASGYVLEDSDLLEIALGDTTSYDGNADAAASVLGPHAVAVMIDAYLEAWSRLRNKDSGYDRAAQDRFSLLRQRLARTQGTSLVAAIAARSDSAKNEELAQLAHLFSNRSLEEDGRGRPFNSEGSESIARLAETWASRLLEDRSASRSAKADIARMIGHAPTPALLPTLQRLLDDNLRLYHEFCEAAKASKWRDRAAVTQAQNPHLHEYQTALIAIRAPETFDLVAGYLTHEHFGECAARILAVQWAEECEPKEDRRLMGGIDFSRVSARRSARQTRPNESCPEADAIFAAVETLISDGTREEQHKRAVVLGSIGARLPHGNRAAVFEKLIACAPRQPRAALVLGLVLSGEDVPMHLIAKGIYETLEDAKAHTWILTDGESYQLRDWLRLLPFGMPLAQIPEIIARLPDAQRTPRMLEEMIRNLGQSTPMGGQHVLFELAEDDPRLYQDHQWQKSVMGLQGEHSARGIVDLILSGKLNEASAYGRLHDEIARLLRDNPETRAHVHDLLRDGPKTKGMELLVHGLAQNPTPDDVVLLVKCEVATQRSFLAWRSIETAVTAHVPSETWRGAFDVMPIPSTWLRRELLALTGDGGKNDPAARCLTEIDKVRDRYGAPDAEPRHPHLASGRPWPILTPGSYAEEGG